MKTDCRTIGTETYFVVSDLDPAYHPAARKFCPDTLDGNLAKCYPAATPHLDRIYQHFARSIEAAILQLAGVQPVPWDRALHALLELVDKYPIGWWLTGSAALAVRGVDIVPGDLDLIVAGVSAARFEALLGDYLIEPIRPGGISDSFGRAFLHARIEWLAGVDARADEPVAGDVGPVAARQLETIIWHGYSIRVPPLALQLQVNERRGLVDRVAQIRALLDRAV